MDIKLSNFISEGQILSGEQVSTFLRTFKNNVFEDALIGIGENSTVDKKVRNVTQYSLHRNEKSMTEMYWLNYLLYKINHLRTKYINFHSLEYAEKVECINILKYEVGGKYIPHVDSSNNLDTRMYSIIIFLNNDYKGGRLQFVYKDQTLEIEPYPGKAVIWPSNLLFKHGVTPVTEGTRYTMVSWICS